MTDTAEQLENYDLQEEVKEEGQEEVTEEVKEELKEKEEAQEEKKREFVPINEHENLKAALNEERNRRKEIRRQQESQQAMIQKMEERFAQLQERFGPKEEVPPFDDNPAEHLRYQQSKLQEQINEQKTEAEKRKEYEKYQSHIAGLQTRVASHETAFSKQNADYYDAVDYLRERRDKDYQAMGITDPAERAQLVQNDALFIAQNALQREQDPASVFYTLARNYGFSSKPSSAEEKIENARKGQQASKTLGSQAGKKGGLSLQTVATMSDEEFDNLSEDDWERLWQ